MKKPIFLTMGCLAVSCLGAGLALFQSQWLLAVILFMVSIGLSIAIYWLKAQNTLMVHLIKTTKEVGPKTESQYQNTLLNQQIAISMLQSQINPHFLYNTLESIRSEALVNGQKGIAEMTEHLSRFFRYCISSKEDIVSLAEEVSNIQDYFSIQHYRFGNRMTFDIKLEDESLLDCYLPKLILQPLVENAIVHGLEEVDRPGQVLITILGCGKDLYITVSDNGAGMSYEALQEMNDKLRNNSRLNTDSEKGSRHTGIAMGNVNARIQLYFGQEYGLHFRSIPGEGTDAELFLPKVNVVEREQLARRLQGERQQSEMR